ncbi:MAG: dTDP-4-dehydrorhamnose reductase [Polaromonas sp.]|uniref:dTDP-4-dehydrorhamnose reductase n=1 Tax=Polaromonas sp. TaxID=1869339 RepID=UPI002730F4B4|nr:dTDP-4-dehydrorhamnose reductase [Polaromonas sp.]MDP2450455.1 dTDP-4-dehydrorhamnose reductase [Polaromonas sp.]MDP3247191.1 dTDP-4-dehydrorhamnose reductase [Polaromonas sp.]MDP3756607.1 dTDP-4-dehydrorhamnose reductase [Polaromonas sp.]MDP3828073.1 dTDP-4-dehydrorhamnose reductase [Polaromonas sp.]
MKILLFGKNGQVGWELQRSLAPLGELVAFDRYSTDLCGDLVNLAGIGATVRQVRPDVIVNAAAYTAVDKAESDAATAHAVNAEAPGVLAEAASAVGAWLVHYSTDYVFDGSGSKPWKESDPTGPLNVYGQSKLEGEQRIVAHCAKHLIMRTSWVYAARGGNFAKTMLRLAAERDHLSVINDQHGAPTGADLLADVTAHMVRSALRGSAGDFAGTYHVAAAGETSWHGYARFVIDYASRSGLALKASSSAVAPVPTTAFPTPAMRPRNSRLNTAKLQASFDLQLPAWQQGVARLLAEII